jgi:hypothetical protein
MSLVFLGWAIGWITAALGRLVYPAPRTTLIARETPGE